MRRARPWLELTLLGVLAGAVLAGAPWPGRSPAIGLPTGLAAAAVTGTGLALLLGGLQRGPALRLRPLGLHRLAVGAVLVAVAGGEEVVFRRGVLDALAGPAGPAGAVALAACCFAVAHGPSPHRVAAHAATGATFGAVYALSGRLSAATLAHAAYNLTVLAGADGAPTAQAPFASARLAPTRPAPAPIAALSGVTKRFRGNVALHDVDLEVRPGEAVALLGPNGAGKTTALSILLGLRRPDAGEARLFGLEPRDPAARARLGVTPQASGFPPTLRVDEVIRLAAAHFPDPVPAAELLDRFGLGQLRRRQAGGLSGGEARRLALALAFVGRPALVVLDEPTGALDVETRRLAWDGIRAYREAGGTVLLTSHHLDEVEVLATRVIVLAAGRRVAEDTVAGVRALAGLTRISLAHAPAMPVAGVLRSERFGNRVVLYAIDAAPVVRALVASGERLGGLEVRPASLEEAVLELSRRAT